jgi:antitoxin ParD1/3/4
MDRNTSISLGSYFDDFIKRKLASGRYKNASEVVRAGLRLLEEEESKYISLKESINEGVSSGVALDFDAEEHLLTLKAKRK